MRLALEIIRQSISIHTPHAGSDATHAYVSLAYAEFQSTLPMRGVTGIPDVEIATPDEFQSTLPMRGVTEQKNDIIEVDGFQSTLPMRGVTF